MLLQEACRAVGHKGHMPLMKNTLMAGIGGAKNSLYLVIEGRHFLGGAEIFYAENVNGI